MSYRILLASHEEVVRTGVKRYLLELGYQVETVERSSQILDTVRRYSPALIIIDVEFPASEMDGWQVARILRQEYENSVLPIFLLIYPGHGYTYLEPEKKWLYDHILVHPVELKEISQGVEKLLGQ